MCVTTHTMPLLRSFRFFVWENGAINMAHRRCCRHQPERHAREPGLLSIFEGQRRDNHVKFYYLMHEREGILCCLTKQYEELRSHSRNLTGAIRYFSDAETCHDFLCAMRWPRGVQCPSCNSKNIGKLVVITKNRKGEALKVPRRVWNCKNCRKQFTVKVGTIFEDSPLGLDKWIPATWLIVNTKNGISSCELERSLGRHSENRMVHATSHPFGDARWLY